MTEDASPDRTERADNGKKAGGEGARFGRTDIFFAAVALTRMPMIVTDPRQPDNPVVFANQAFQAMTGYGADEIVGTNCRFLQGAETDPETIADLRQAIVERREFAAEILNYRKDGYSFWNALFVSPVFDEAGELVHFFGSQLDVTRRREAEENLRQAQKMEALGRLTGGIAHDFNNLLQVIVGYLELIGSGLQKPAVDHGRLGRHVENARSAAERAAALTQQLLAFARKQRLQGQTVNLNDLVRSMRDLGARTLGDDVTLETDLADTLANCRVDPSRIETALLNVLINARDAMVGQREKRLAIATTNVTVERDDIAIYQGLGPGRYVAISVTDTGRGIPAHAIERVMDPFFTTKEEGRGPGLGLSMVYGFAKQSGGLAHIVSTEGVGTIVRIYLPAVDDAAPPHQSDRGSALERPGSETILVVEDRADVAELARTILGDLGYTVLLARDARDALQVLGSTSEIDLLFSDLIMPGEMNGVALAREAKRHRGRLKILLTTGYSEASLERADVGGAEFDVLNKPYGRTELARKVRVVLDGPTGVS